MQKKVSIIMGIYNCESTIKESIESILNQKYQNFELIMCDDNSMDKTYDIAKSYEKLYPNKIKVIKNEKNLTLGPTLNNCLKLCKGYYIARQDADDKSHYLRIEKQIKFLEENLEYDLVGTNMIAFNEEKTLGNRENNLRIPKKEDLIKKIPFFHATILCKKSVYDKLNGYSFDKFTKRSEDTDLWFRFFKENFKGYNLNEGLYYVREDGNQYKRRDFENYFNAFITSFKGVHLLKLSKKYYIYAMVILIKYFIPDNLKKKYHKKKLEA